MAVVYLADDLKHHRSVAVKVLHPELAAALGHERFLREVEISARLQHPHILTLIDSGEADGFVYYVMPFVDGTSLRARIAREHELPVADVVRIIREVADALSEAHAHGVVHRDVKPDNVLLRGQHAVVTDFGVAKAVSESTGLHELTSVGVTLGTPTYMAPEQAAGDPGTDHRADIYALGVMAYEMLVGAPPFSGPTPQSVLAAHMTQQPVSISSRRSAVPEGLAATIMRCLEKRPADRWQTVNDLLAQLDSVWTPGAGTLPAPVPVPTVAAPRPSRRRAAIAVLAALALVGAGGYALRARVGSSAAGHRAGPPTVAVLPFENLGAPNDEYFADGMTEEITGRLAKLSGLAVIARTSVIQYKKTTKPITQIAKELGADFLIEGTVRWEKTPDGRGRVRIAPQVIRGSDGTHVWADRFDKPYGTDIFAIQSDIAENVARALDVTLRPGDQGVVRQVPTTNLAAYDAYLRAQSYVERNFGQDWEAYRLAFESVEEAVRLDSGFAPAYALLAKLHSDAIGGGYDISLGTGVSFEQRAELGRAAAERAIAIDSMSSTAHRILAIYYAVVARDTARQRAELALAIRGDPSSPDAIGDRGLALMYMGRNDEALRELERAATLDPRNARRWTAIALLHGRAKNYRLYAAALDRAIGVAPTEASLYVQRAWSELMQGDQQKARATVREGIARAGVTSVLFAAAKGTLWANMIRILHDDLGESATRLTLKEFGADSIDYYEAKLRAYWPDRARMRAYFDSTVAWSMPRAKKSTQDAFYQVELAYALAGAGRRDEAVRAMQPVIRGRKFRVSGAVIESAAEACVLIGDFDCAVTYVARALAETPGLTPAIFRLDPFWDPLRARADFRKLVEQQ